MAYSSSKVKFFISLKAHFGPNVCVSVKLASLMRSRTPAAALVVVPTKKGVIRRFNANSMFFYDIWWRITTHKQLMLCTYVRVSYLSQFTVCAFLDWNLTTQCLNRRPSIFVQSLSVPWDGCTPKNLLMSTTVCSWMFNIHLALWLALSCYCPGKQS